MYFINSLKKNRIFHLLKWILIILVAFTLISAILYFFTEPKQNRDWVAEHALLPSINFNFDNGNKDNPIIKIKHIRDFNWQAPLLEQKIRHKEMQFQLNNIVELKAVVSHFSAISEIAHVFMIFVLDDGRELGVSVEARREQGEAFSISGGLLAKFELMYVLATPEDLLGIRKINHESVHVYPIKETKEKAREMFMLIANNVNALVKQPEMYHLFFKNCTNQLVKHVSILTQQRYPWFFQTVAPGKTGKILYQLDLIDLPDTNFEDIQNKTLIK